MKLLLYSDPHWCSYSSIIRTRGSSYSTRLENLIQSIQWVENLAEYNQVDKIICCGDFFDKSELNSEEIAALSEIKWSNIAHIFLAGNHEMGNYNHLYSTAKLFNMRFEYKVITEPSIYLMDNSNVLFLPYVLEKDREPISKYIEYCDLIVSHNDIANIQMGKYLSKEGYKIEDIESHCNLCINGHIHNSEFISRKILNIGNLTGLNFSEDASKYSHYAIIIDTNNINVDSIQFFENPFAFNFYKIEVDNQSDFDKYNFKTNAIVSITSSINDLIINNSNILIHKIIKRSNAIKNDKEAPISLKRDHISQFIEYCRQNFEATEVMESELKEITKQ